MSTGHEKEREERRKAAEEATKEEAFRRQRAEINLLRCLLAIMVFDSNRGVGDVWRVVFSPAMIELGKKFRIDIDAGEGALLPQDVIAIAKDYLKIEIPAEAMLNDIEPLKKLLDPIILKKTFVVSVQPNQKALEVAGKEASAGQLAEKVEAPREGRGRFRYCEICKELTESIHVCKTA